MASNVAVLLSGCGFLDGSEIHEAVLTLLHLQRNGANTRCLAPRIPQADVVDHAAAAPDNGSSRNVFVEAARIARGKIVDLEQARADDYDAAVLPGGFGAAKNLCDFAFRGAAAKVLPAVERFLRAMHAAHKPIGAVCIAPAVLAATFGATLHPTLTIGNDAGTAAALEAMGARHRECPVTDCVVDADNRIVTTPAYMYDARVDEVSTGIGKLADAIAAMLAAGGR